MFHYLFVLPSGNVPELHRLYQLLCKQPVPKPMHPDVSAMVKNDCHFPFFACHAWVHLYAWVSPVSISILLFISGFVFSSASVQLSFLNPRSFFFKWLSGKQRLAGLQCKSIIYPLPALYHRYTISMLTGYIYVDNQYFNMSGHRQHIGNA
jgi:hypothetical protein